MPFFKGFKEGNSPDQLGSEDWLMTASVNEPLVDGCIHVHRPVRKMTSLS
jgi:hypothetical protein